MPKSHAYNDENGPIEAAGGVASEPVVSRGGWLNESMCYGGGINGHYYAVSAAHRASLRSAYAGSITGSNQSATDSVYARRLEKKYRELRDILYLDLSLLRAPPRTPVHGAPPQRDGWVDVGGTGAGTSSHVGRGGVTEKRRVYAWATACADGRGQRAGLGLMDRRRGEGSVGGKGRKRREGKNEGATSEDTWSLTPSLEIVEYDDPSSGVSEAPSLTKRVTFNAAHSAAKRPLALSQSHYTDETVAELVTRLREKYRVEEELTAALRRRAKLAKLPHVPTTKSHRGPIKLMRNKFDEEKKNKKKDNDDSRGSETREKKRNDDTNRRKDEEKNEKKSSLKDSRSSSSSSSKSTSSRSSRSSSKSNSTRDKSKSSSRSHSKSRSKSPVASANRRESLTDPPTETKTRTDIRDWLRHKNKLIRQQKRAAKALEKQKQEADEKKRIEKEARKQESDMKVRQWMEEKRMEERVRLLKERRRSMSALNIFESRSSPLHSSDTQLNLTSAGMSKFGYKLTVLKTRSASSAPIRRARSAESEKWSKSVPSRATSGVWRDGRRPRSRSRNGSAKIYSQFARTQPTVAGGSNKHGSTVDHDVIAKQKLVEDQGKKPNNNPRKQDVIEKMKEKHQIQKEDVSPSIATPVMAFNRATRTSETKPKDTGIIKHRIAKKPRSSSAGYVVSYRVIKDQESHSKPLDVNIVKKPQSQSRDSSASNTNRITTNNGVKIMVNMPNKNAKKFRSKSVEASRRRELSISQRLMLGIAQPMKPGDISRDGTPVKMQWTSFDADSKRVAAGPMPRKKKKNKTIRENESAVNTSSEVPTFMKPTMASEWRYGHEVVVNRKATKSPPRIKSTESMIRKRSANSARRRVLSKSADVSMLRVASKSPELTADGAMAKPAPRRPSSSPVRKQSAKTDTRKMRSLSKKEKQKKKVVKSQNFVMDMNNADRPESAKIKNESLSTKKESNFAMSIMGEDTPRRSFEFRRIRDSPETPQSRSPESEMRRNNAESGKAKVRLDSPRGTDSPVWPKNSPTTATIVDRPLSSDGRNSMEFSSFMSPVLQIGKMSPEFRKGMPELSNRRSNSGPWQTENASTSPKNRSPRNSPNRVTPEISREEIVTELSINDSSKLLDKSNLTESKKEHNVQKVSVGEIRQNGNFDQRNDNVAIISTPHASTEIKAATKNLDDRKKPMEPLNTERTGSGRPKTSRSRNITDLERNDLNIEKGEFEVDTAEYKPSWLSKPEEPTNKHLTEKSHSGNKVNRKDHFPAFDSGKKLISGSGTKEEHSAASPIVDAAAEMIVQDQPSHVFGQHSSEDPGSTELSNNGKAQPKDKEQKQLVNGEELNGLLEMKGDGSQKYNLNVKEQKANLDRLKKSLEQLDHVEETQEPPTHPSHSPDRLMPNSSESQKLDQAHVQSHPQPSHDRITDPTKRGITKRQAPEEDMNIASGPSNWGSVVDEVEHFWKKREQQQAQQHKAQEQSQQEQQQMPQHQQQQPQQQRDQQMQHQKQQKQAKEQEQQQNSQQLELGSHIKKSANDKVLISVGSRQDENTGRSKEGGSHGGNKEEGSSGKNKKGEISEGIWKEKALGDSKDGKSFGETKEQRKSKVRKEGEDPERNGKMGSSLGSKDGESRMKNRGGKTMIDSKEEASLEDDGESIVRRSHSATAKHVTFGEEHTAYVSRTPSDLEQEDSRNTIGGHQIGVHEPLTGGEGDADIEEIIEEVE